VTEDGLRAYNIQLWIFLFVTSKSKETLWLCVLGLLPLKAAELRASSRMRATGRLHGT
jgi:hypothetical protein